MLFIKESVFPASVEELFAFHERPDAFALLQPPWEQTEIVVAPASLEVGTRVVFRTKVGPFWTELEAEHIAFERNVRFEDTLIRGPFAKWHHRHLFFEDPNGARLRDEIDCEPPLGVVGRWFGEPIVRRRLTRMFDYRHEATRRVLLHM